MDEWQEISLREVHEVQIRLWRALDEACSALGIRYFAVHGTLLGAARDGGFIPWDDDMDFAMPREDYDRLIRHAGEVFRLPLFLQTEDSDRGCYFGGYARLMDESTTFLGYPEMIHPCHQGIRIDIMPLDGLPEGREGIRLQKRISRLQRILFAKYYPVGSGILAGLSPGEMARLALEASLIPGRLVRKRLKMLYRQGRDGNTLTFLTCLYGSMPNRNRFPGRWFETAERLPFEGGTIPAPAGYREFLASRYGKDYLAPPEKEWQVPGHLAFRDAGKSYRDQDRARIREKLKKLAQLEINIK